MDITNLSLDRIKFSTRSRNVLQKNGIDTVEKLLKLGRDELMAFANSGLKSTNEILQVIEAIKNKEYSTVISYLEDADVEVESPEDFYTWIEEAESKKFVSYFFKGIKTDALTLLPPKAYNLLLFNGVEYLDKLIYCEDGDLLKINHMDICLVNEIKRAVHDYLEEKKTSIIKSYCAYKKASAKNTKLALIDKLYIAQHQPLIKEFLKQNDKALATLDISNRAKNVLKNNGYVYISEIFHLDLDYFKSLKASGVSTAQEIVDSIYKHIDKHSVGLEAYLKGDKSVLMADSVVAAKILDLYKKAGFKGLSMQNIKDELMLPSTFSEEKLKTIIGELIASNELEYVDYRCYRVYKRFDKCLEEYDGLSDRDREIMRKRLQGMTLDEIGKSLNLTRERIRQIIDKNVKKIKEWHQNKTGMAYFDEDYYACLYSTYKFDKKEASKWLGISTYIWKYLEMVDVTPGSKKLQNAIDDVANLDIGLRLKIKNYLNRNKIFIDGIWLEKNSITIANALAKKFCQKDTTYDEFRTQYNNFLKQEGIAEGDNLYIDDEVSRSRKDHLMNSPYVLWKLHETFRYYDIQGNDYSNLFDTLNLEAYENIELSTAKLFKENPEIMREYDIHDHYELHNLLRKTLPSGSYNNFHCGKMPNICFGIFDKSARFKAFYNILLENSENGSISAERFANIITDMYGFDHDVIINDYLLPFRKYLHNGVYKVEPKVMSEENKELLRTQLTDEFYFFDELREIYRKIAPAASIEEINPYNLNLMGFKVNSNYILINKDTADKYYESILTAKDMVNIAPYRKRFASLWNFFTKLSELKRKYDVIEFEHNMLINIKKLQKSGITKADLKNYCEKVVEFVNTKQLTYFSIQYLREIGFTSDLDKLGFEETFYASLLKADGRFISNQVYNAEILKIGNTPFTKLTFLEAYIKQAGAINVSDLLEDLNTRFGCKIKDKDHIVYIFNNSTVHYDPILEKLYGNMDIYYNEIESMEEN